MPIYEYVCSACREEFEKLILGRPEPIHCPKCDGADVVKKVSVVSFSTGGKFTSSVAGSGCSGCHATSCSSCSK